MSLSTRLALPFLDAAQSQKHVTHNEALVALDTLVHLSVKMRDMLAPPATPAEGDRYLLSGNPTGAFSGHAGAIAAFDSGGWAFLSPRAGWRCFVESEALLLLHDGAAWRDAGSGVRELQNLTRLGVGASADANNPLLAKLNSALFTARSVAEGGAGDLRLTLNKSAVGNTVSQIYQTNFSGRAETGLAGDDRFHLKVSPDGTNWTEALFVDASTGLVSLPRTAGFANGLATLDAGGKVPATQLPAANSSLTNLTNAEASATLAPGAPVYASGANACRRAQANAFATAGVVALCAQQIAPGATGNIATGGVLTLTTAQWDAVVTGQSGGLAPGVLYFLDASSPGALTNVAPVAAGACIAPLGRALSTTSLAIQVAQPIQL